MTAREMQNAFEIEAARFDSDIMLESHVIFYWINEAQDRFFKTRYSEFEKSEKRTDDLRTLVLETPIATIAGGANDKPNSYIAQLPLDYVLTVGEETTITFTPTEGVETNTRVAVHPISSDEYTKEVNSAYGKHLLHYETATPLSLLKEGVVELISDGNYTIPTYYLRYIKQPFKIELGGQDCELPEHTHVEIVTNAVNLLLENLGDGRYQSNKPEVIEQE